MNYLRKCLISTIIVLSLFLMVGCSSNQAAEEDLSSNISEEEQAPQPAPEPTTTTTQIQRTWKSIDAATANGLIAADATFQIIDLRGRYLYSNKHIKGAKSIDIAEFASEFSEIDETKPVLLYDDTGDQSGSAADFLQQNGYTKVYVLNGGVRSWTFGVEP